METTHSRIEFSARGSSQPSMQLPPPSSPDDGPDHRESSTTLRRVGRYRLLELLGSGGMGKVYRGFDDSLQRPVALKQIRRETAKNTQSSYRFRREAQAVARLNHPNIVRLYDLIEDNEGDWIVMELVEGTTLARMLARGPLTIERALSLAIELTDALSAAHAEGVVHRDLKASNILITPEGDLKVLDFGLARQVPHMGRRYPTVTMEGQILGTPHAMSPEQARGQKVDLRSDLFSLGSLLYEMVTGTSPFQGENQLETMQKICTYHPPSVAEERQETPRFFSELISHLLEKDPAHRPRTAVAVLQHLRTDPASVPGIEPPAAFLQDTNITLAEESAVTRGPVVGSERRQVTVMCCSLVASEDSLTYLDPEKSYAMMADFANLASEVIDEFGGHINRALGHRLMAFFGYPRAHEDDAQHTVHAALTLVDRCQSLLAKGNSQAPSVRIGIHTGTAVVLRDPNGEQVALGQTLDLTTDLEKLAEPNQVLISSATQRLIGGRFEAKPQPRTKLRGSVESVEVFRVHAALEPTSQWRVSDCLTQFVAREQELQLMLDRLELAQAGVGQVVLLSGEAGIGKSRLIQTMQGQSSGNTRAQWFTALGSSSARNSPFYPILDLLRRIFRLEPEEKDATQFGRLQEWATFHGLVTEEVVPLLASLLSIPFKDQYPPLALSPHKQKEKTLMALVSLVQAMSQRRPVVLAIEDLHWIDASTLEFLSLLIEEMVSFPLLLLLTFRTEFEAPWERSNQVTQLNLTRLAAPEIDLLIDQVTKGRRLPPQVHKQIVAKTDGVPLFVEELTKTVLESDLLAEREGRYELMGALEDLAIPATLRDSLTARLDNLGPSKDVAQVAATIGREFSYELIAAVWPREEHILEEELAQLVEAGLVYRKGFSSRRRYYFKHALTQDVAYNSLLNPQKRQVHLRTAAVLEERFPQIVENRPEFVAHHYTEACRLESAIQYWQRAGQRDLQRSATVEATTHLEKGLELLRRSPLVGAKRDLQELMLQSTLAPAVSAVKGFSSPQTGRSYNRALELLRSLDDDPELFWISWGLWAFYISRADYREASPLAQQLMQLAEASPNPGLMIEASYVAGFTCFGLGQFVAANEYLTRSVRRLEQNQLDSVDLAPSPTGLDLEVAVRSVLAVVRWHLGSVDEALQESRAAIDRARRMSHLLSLAMALAWDACLHQHRGDQEAAWESAEEALVLSEEYGFFWVAQAQMYLGWALVRKDRNTRESSETQGSGDHCGDQGVLLVKQGLSTARAAGHRLFQSLPLAAIAENYLDPGRSTEEGLVVLKQALAAVKKTGETFWAAELWRLHGELVSTDPCMRNSEAEEHFKKAIGIARSQGSRSLEQRAAASLFKFQQGRGIRS